MTLNNYLILTPSYRHTWQTSPNNVSIKIVKSLKESRMASNAVALKLNIEIPDEVFKKPTLEATIKVDKNNVSPPVIEASVLNNIKEVLSRELGINMEINVVDPAKQKK